MMSRPGAESWRLILLVAPFIVYGFVELALVVWVAERAGWWTLVALAATAAIGLSLLIREGRRTMDALTDVTRTGHLPRGRMADTTLMLIGAVLLIIPGFVSDLMGLCLVLPFTRPFVRSAISWWAARAMRRHNVAWTGTIEGQVVVDDDSTDPVNPVIEGRIVEDEGPDDAPR
ncbi:MAG TPA: FxsA family protein [Arachnia sp.]|nr:FxsA family protein [Arachnia sp.]HMT85807.1 FxsA family protein [Arachnia sp.]